MSYTALHVHTENSLLDGFSSPDENVKRAVKLGLKGISITDHGNIAGTIDHWSAVEKANKKLPPEKKLKCILGIELYTPSQPAVVKAPANRNNTHMVFWAKNRAGWKQLIKIVSQTNDPDYFYFKPRIHPWNYTDENGKVWPGLEHFLDGNCMAFSGHQGSAIADNLFCDIFSPDPYKQAKLREAYGQYKKVDSEYYRKFLKPNWLEHTCELALKFEKMFGKGNFFIEGQNELNVEDKIPLLVQPIILECNREISKQTGIPLVASADSHYASPEDAEQQRLMVSTNMRETEESIQIKLTESDETDVMVFFGSNNFYIHSYEEMAKNFTNEELEMTNKIADMIEAYDPREKPYIPKFTIPEFNKDASYLKQYKNDSDKFLMELCIRGAKQLQPWKNSTHNKDAYWKRLKEETDTIFSVGLSDYFLVVWDICMAADNHPLDGSFDWQANLAKGGKIKPITRGSGRGSAAGCLISYLTDITGIDPVKHDLIFSRFYNAGRMSEGHISLPDIDLDFEVGEHGRDWILDYIKWKYGKDCVGQIITFGVSKGRNAIKDVFRVKGIDHGLANEICKHVAVESVIADEIQQMIESGVEDYNILKWTLDNSKEFQEYYERDDLKPILDLAMKCEGVKRNQGKHPSGIVISNQKLDDVFPMVYDAKTKSKIVGFDLKSAEKMGAAKFDILGVAVLSKLAMVQEMVNANND
jgi:DNA polymerase-3 subunit alpha